MSTPILSLIIPVYRAEYYIRACLNSVFKQIPDGVEVILVNDGTPDMSMHVVREHFAQNINSGQLILIDQTNMGPGAARNAGIRKANGNYIAFLDSDDVLLDGYFDEVTKHLTQDAVDVIEFGFKRFSNDEDISSVVYKPLYGFHGMRKLIDVREDVFSVGCWYPWTRIYRKKIFENHFFPEGTHYEDLMTIPFIYLRNLLVYFIDKPLLGYRYNPESITSNHTKKHLMEMHGFYKSIVNDLDPACDAVKVLKLKMARGMIFFGAELGSTNFPVDELVADTRRMTLQPATRKKLLLADWLFFHFPASYARIDKIRVPLKKQLQRLKERVVALRHNS